MKLLAPSLNFPLPSLFLHELCLELDVNVNVAEMLWEIFISHIYALEWRKMLSSWQFRSLPHCSWTNRHCFMKFSMELKLKTFNRFHQESHVSFANDIFFSNFHLTNDESRRRFDDGYRSLAELMQNVNFSWHVKQICHHPSKRQQQWRSWMSRRRLDFSFFFSLFQFCCCLRSNMIRSQQCWTTQAHGVARVTLERLPTTKWVDKLQKKSISKIRNSPCGHVFNIRLAHIADFKIK